MQGCVAYGGGVMAEWTIDINKWAEKQGQRIKDIQRNVVFALYSAIVEKTPVDTGRARGNWNVSPGAPDYHTDYNQKTRQYTSAEQLPKAEGVESLFIANNLPYITALEYGHSKQAPQGMVGLAMARAQQIVAEAINAGGSE